MTQGHEFDKEYWERHWVEGRKRGPGSMRDSPALPYLAEQTAHLAAGTALDAGCGAGAEALWLAERGWEVTGVDISAEALARAAERAAASGATVRWVEADLSTWQPEGGFDLVTSHYAHPAMPQLDFYERIGAWVAPGGTLLVVGHHEAQGHGHGHGHGHGQPPPEASVTGASVRARLEAAGWEVVTAEERRRTVPGREVPLDDVVVRAVRRQPAGGS
jgi:SAM-dependent methyltransferase